LFAVGATVLIVRFLVRLRTVGLRNFQGDDYIALLVLICYTGDALTVSYSYWLGTNSDFTPEQLAKFDDEQLRRITIGSRLELTAWYSYTLLLWALKGCVSDGTDTVHIRDVGAEF